MKKTYMKPEANEIEVASNQAIAACGYAKGVSVEYLGWNTTTQGGAEGSLFFDTFDGPAAYYGDKLQWGPRENYTTTTYQCYRVKVDGDLVFNFEDMNGNNAWDGNGIDHYQSVHSHTDIAGILINS